MYCFSLLIYADTIFRNREGLQLERGKDTDFVGKLILASIANQYDSDISTCYYAKKINYLKILKVQELNISVEIKLEIVSQFCADDSVITIN